MSDFKVDGIESYSSPEGQPFPFDAVAKGQGVIGKTVDGEIMFVLPPVALGGTFFLLYPNHLPFSCEFVDSMAAHMTDEKLTTAIKGLESGTIGKMLSRLKERHGKAEFTPDLIHTSDEGVFDGMYYGVMNNLDLAAIAVVMQELWDAVPDSTKEATPDIARIAQMWIQAGEGMTTEIERRAVLLMQDIGNA